MLLVLLFPVAGFFIFYISKKYGDPDNISRGFINNRQGGMIVGIFLMTSMGLFAFYIVPTMIYEYVSTKNIYNHDLSETVEGRVENCRTSDRGTEEEFDVNGVHFFFYNDEIKKYGYHLTDINGGAITANVYVRIKYISEDNQNIILKLESE